MELRKWRNHEKAADIIQITLTDDDMTRAVLTPFERAVLDTPHERLTDVLMDLNIMAQGIERATIKNNEP